jgi:putative FmdB family regulatory protein
MPIYEYRCAKCGNDFDRFFTSHKKMTETKIVCPNCASKRVKRLISAPRLKSGDGALGDEGDEGGDDTPAASGLMGRKEIAEITAKRKKAGLPG